MWKVWWFGHWTFWLFYPESIEGYFSSAFLILTFEIPSSWWHTPISLTFSLQRQTLSARKTLNVSLHLMHFKSEVQLLQLVCSLCWINFLIRLRLKEVRFQSFAMPNPLCLDEFLNQTETSYCLISPLMMSLQIDEGVFHAY